MPFITVESSRDVKVNVYCESHGKGDPIVLIHAYSLSCISWEKQIRPLVSAGYRVILYDRRGFGKSDQPSRGYDLDTLASDLNSLFEALDLRNAVLVGHSMGGAEVIRYLSKYGTARVKKAIYIAAVNPYLKKAPDNPEGLDGRAFADFQSALLNDRPATLADNLAEFYSDGTSVSTLASKEKLAADFIVAANASPIAVHDCVDVWLTDLRKDHEAVSIPSLVIHGTADVSIPFEASGKRTALYPNTSLVVVHGAPHGVIWSHSEETNKAILEFIANSSMGFLSR
jgi:non-heme chloroperoxidase